jgi:hypothetical protein
MNWKEGKRILRYVNETKDFDIKYSTSEDFKLIGYTDSDCGGSIDDRKSTSGYTFHYGIGMVSWASRKHPIVTLSSAEAEYVAATSCNLSSSMDEKNFKRFVAGTTRTNYSFM